LSEFALLATFALAGWLFISSFGMTGWVAVPLSFIAGTFLVVLAGFITVITGLSTRPGVVLCAALVIAAGFFAIRRGWQYKRVWKTLAASIASLLPLVVLFQEANLVSWNVDSFRYLTSAGLLANDHYELAESALLEKRLLSGPVVHSMAQTYGATYLQAFSPALSLALVGVLAWTVQQAGKRSYASAYVSLVVGLTVLLFVTNNRMVFNAFFISNHLIFGVALVCVCSASYMMIRGSSPSTESLFAVLLLAVPVLIVSRAEGFIAAGLALLPLVLDVGLSVKRRLLVLLTYGSATFLWFGYVFLAAETSVNQALGEDAVTSAAPMAAGLVVLASAPVLPWSRLVKLRRLLLPMIEVGLWCALAAFVVQDPEILNDTLQPSFENVVQGAGGWGYSLIVLSLLVVIALLTSRGAALVALRFPLTSFIPVLVLVAYFREGGYRVGEGDSLNRMLMQFVPLAVLYVGVAVLDWRSTKSDEAPQLAPEGVKLGVEHAGNGALTGSAGLHEPASDTGGKRQ
jgi:hypothetical protein